MVDEEISREYKHSKNAMSQARMTVENMFQRLKRFSKHIDMEISLLVTALCILHNIGEAWGNDFFPEYG